MEAKRKYTIGERIKYVRLEIKGARRATAGIESSPHLDRQIEALREKARKRANGK